MDNTYLVLLTTVIELLDRYGLTPCDTDVSLDVSPSGERRLHMRAPPPESGAADRFLRMVAALGLMEPPYELAGDDKEVYDTLQEAIQRAPRGRTEH